MLKNKTLLMIGAGVEQIPAIQRAKKLGLFVVVTDGNPDAPGIKYADDFLCVSTYDVKKTVLSAKEYSKKRKINGVIAVAADVPKTVAAAADNLGLEGITSKTAELASDKLKMKKCFMSCNIPIPWFQKVNSFKELKTIVKKRGFPLVIKPVDSRGARGILKLSKEVNVEWAYNYSLSFSPAKKVMIEEFLSGPQVSTESIILKDKSYTIGFTDRNYDDLEKFMPFMIENGGTQPTLLSDKTVKEINLLIEKAASAIGIKNGVVKGDIVVHNGVPKVIEIAARLSGGWFCTDQIPLSTGVDFLQQAYKIALGEKLRVKDLTPQYHKGCAIRYWFPPVGKIIKIKGIRKLSKMPGVKKYGFFCKPGEHIKKVSNHTERVGFVITVGKDREQAMDRMKDALDSVQFEIKQ